jgi:predicted DNA-binding transcriptional regulator AlpA
MAKPEVLALTSLTYPTLWLWMREGRFPRARQVGGKTMWLSTDIDAWLAALPTRRLKGDPVESVAKPVKSTELLA